MDEVKQRYKICWECDALEAHVANPFGPTCVALVNGKLVCRFLNDFVTDLKQSCPEGRW